MAHAGKFTPKKTDTVKYMHHLHSVNLWHPT